MGTRIRVVCVTVALQAVLDDGDSLTPATIEPVTLSPAQFAMFNLTDQVAALQAQIEE